MFLLTMHSFKLTGTSSNKWAVFTLNIVPLYFIKLYSRPIRLLSTLAVTPVRIVLLEGRQCLIDVDVDVTILGLRGKIRRVEESN